jgi:competence protein ComEC
MARGEPDSTANLAVKGVQVVQASLALQRTRMMLWSPVFLIAGIWTYFNLPTEPSGMAVAILALFVVVLLWIGRKSALSFMVAMLLLGFVVAKLRQEVVMTPLLRAFVAESYVAGYVADADNRGGKRRIIVVELDSATNIPEGEMPRRVRISTFNAPGVLIGDYITMKARLSPLPMPVAPGGFDYGRDLYFQSIGAMGQGSSPPIIEMKDVPYKFVIRRFFHSMRSAMGARIIAVIPGPLGAFANAVITGERAAIPKDMNTSLQISGLAHILSISGLHMTLVAGGVFWVVRAFLALFPFMALHYPIKKWAAVAALIVGLIYMLLADSGSATERSYIMIAVMFFAMLVDRPAVSLRNLAISALLILIVTPEEAMGASFQMSFLACMGLAAFFEWWNHRAVDVKQMAASRSWRFISQTGKTIAGSVLTTVVAGGLSSIAAAYHFGRMAPYGTLANGLSLPVVGIVVMPAALTSAMLMPFGLEEWPLKLMELGLQATMWISDFVAGLPGANVLMPKPALASVVISVLGSAILCIGVGRFRLLGVAAMLFGMLTSQFVQRPQILIEERASNVAVFDAQGHYVFADHSKGKFAGEKWLQGNGEITTLNAAASTLAWTCAENMCFADVGDTSVAYIHEQAEADWTCPPVDIVIADFPLRHACRDVPTRIDRFDVWRHGAHAIYFQDGKIRISTTKAEQGDRPWVYVSRARPTPYVKKPPPPELPITAFSG